MNGAGMLLKSLGIDPEAMQNTVGEFKAVFERLSETLVRIEGKLDRVLAAQDDVIDRKAAGLATLAELAPDSALSYTSDLGVSMTTFPRD